MRWPERTFFEKPSPTPSDSLGGNERREEEEQKGALSPSSRRQQRYVVVALCARKLTAKRGEIINAGICPLNIVIFCGPIGVPFLSQFDTFWESWGVEERVFS